MIRFPEPLRPGDTIAVTAPSSGVPVSMHPRLDLALASLRKRGFRVVEGRCLRANNQHVSAPAKVRSDELEGFFFDPSISAVMPPWGGQIGMDLLLHLDFERLSMQTPKWFCGFSDLSTLQLPLLLKSGWAGLHGPNLMELATPAETADAIWKVLSTPSGGKHTQKGSRLHQRDNVDWIGQPEATLAPAEPTQWRRLDDEGPITLSGRLVGGCVDTLSRIAGTAFGDLPGFARAHAAEGVLLFLENAQMQPCELARALLSLRLHGWFDNIAGVIFGRDASVLPHSSDDFTSDHAIALALEGLDLPVLLDLDIGHVPPQLALVQGAFATVEFYAGNGCAHQQHA